MLRQAERWITSSLALLAMIVRDFLAPLNSQISQAPGSRSRPPSGCAGWSARTNCPASSAIRHRLSSAAASAGKTIRQRPDSDSPVLPRSRLKEKYSRRARTARDFSHRGEGGTHRLTFAFAAPTYEVPPSKAAYHDEVHSNHCGRASRDCYCNASVRAGRDTGARSVCVLSSQCGRACGQVRGSPGRSSVCLLRLRRART